MKFKDLNVYEYIRIRKSTNTSYGRITMNRDDGSSYKAESQNREVDRFRVAFHRRK